MGPAWVFGPPLEDVRGGKREATLFIGRAFAVSAEVPGIRTVLSDSGLVSASGGVLQDSLLTANVPALLTADVLHAAVVAQADYSHSEASVADLVLSVPGVLQVTAGLFMARASAHGTFGIAEIRGDSEITALTVNGTAITASGRPNQTLTLSDMTVVLNERVATGSLDITINALHLMVEDPLTPAHRKLDVVIGSAQAGLRCGTVEEGRGDFVTGGGWFTGTPSGARGTFAVAGGLDHKVPWGHLSYIDHGADLRVEGTSVTSYKITNKTTRHITGRCAVNRENGFSYTCMVADEGEEGRNDVFSLFLSNGYSAGSELAGGDIQIHKPGPAK